MAVTTSTHPVETLRISKHFGGTTTTIDRIDANGQSWPIYMIFFNNTNTHDKYLQVHHADPYYQHRDGGQPLGTVRFHSLSSKIDVTVRGVSFRMARRDLFSSSHTFSFLGASEMHWKESSFLGTGGVMLVDAEGRTLARYRKRLQGFRGGFGPGIELYVPVADVDLDVLVVTCLAAAEYRRKSNRDVDEAITEMATAS